jgi:phosphoribosylformylglycinamidine synthase
LIGATVDLSGVAADRQSAADQASDKDAALSPDAATLRRDAVLFGETQSRVVISCAPLDAVKIVERARLMEVPAVRIGTVGGAALVVQTTNGELAWPVAELRDLWWSSLARAMA